jgi:hypothetical protein
LGADGRRLIHLGPVWLGSSAGARIRWSGPCCGWNGLAGGDSAGGRAGRIGHGGTGRGANLSRRHSGVYSGRHRRTDERRLARDHTSPSYSSSRSRGRSSRALQASGGLGADALLHLRGALGCSPCPLAQALDLTRLGKGQQRKQCDPQQRCEASDRAYLGKGARQRQCKRQRVHSVHTFRGELMAPGSL